MTAKAHARVTHQFAVPAERVYDAWLDPAQVRLWMPAALREIGLTGEMKEIEVDARVGGTFLFSDLRNGVEARHWGSYLELERPHKIAFTWITDVNDEADPSKVSLTIAPADDGCVADMVHEIDAKWAEFAERIGQSWARMLRAIANELAR